jgi:carboxylesterase type B
MIVRTSAGRVRGTITEGVSVFPRRPQAAPPFGANRLRP